MSISSPSSSAAVAVSPPEKRVTLGRIGGVFGVKGWVKVQSFTRPAENLLDYAAWWIAPPDRSLQQPRTTSAQPRALIQVPNTLFLTRVAEIREQKADFVAQLCGADGTPIEDRDIAARLVGREIQVDRAHMPDPEPGLYYWADLIGLNVRSTSGAELGIVTDMMDNGAQDVLIIDDHGTQRMIPFVRGPIVQRVDLAERVIVVEWEADY